MQLQRRRDTDPEVELRRRLHRMGLRFTLQAEVPGTSRTIDISFPRAHVAVDVRGCYWHACGTHGVAPKANASWWRAKLAGNRSRDADTEQRLQGAGWEVVVVWEHEAPVDAAERVVSAVRRRCPSRPSAS